MVKKRNINGGSEIEFVIKLYDRKITLKTLMILTILMIKGA